MKTEDLKIDRDDLNFKVEDFVSGKSNVLLVTGFAGSGKTTLASELAEKYDALHFQLDWFTDFMFGETTMKELKEQDEIGLIEYIKTNNLEGGQDYDSFEESEIVTMIRDYIKFLINWCKEQDDKFIIEGLSLYDIFQEGDDFITSCPMIIKGTSAETATRRAAKRNVEVDPETEEEDWYQELIKFADADDKKLQALERELGLAEDFAAYDQMWEWLDDNGKRVTSTGGAIPMFELDDEICDGCACVVDPTYCLFGEPYYLINKHKLCDSCLAEWIKLPKGFVDKFLLVGSYNSIDGQVDEFIENLKLEQQDIDNMINEWNKRKQAGTLGISQHEIDTIENDFCDAATLLHLTANKADFI